MKTLQSLLATFSLLYFASCNSPQTENKVQAVEPAPAAEAQQPPSETAKAGKAYILQKEQSAINWKGSNKFTPKFHTGTIQFTQGSFTVTDNNLTGGSFTADMNTISVEANEYTEGTKKTGFLESHLKSADFFDVEKFPTATFTITAVKILDPNSKYTYDITGNFTIKGITKEITFPANVVLTGNNLTGSATFTLDRSQWDVRWGSPTFFPDMAKDKLLNNEIELTLYLVANANAAS